MVITNPAAVCCLDFLGLAKSREGNFEEPGWIRFQGRWITGVYPTPVNPGETTRMTWTIHYIFRIGDPNLNLLNLGGRSKLKICCDTRHWLHSSKIAQVVLSFFFLVKKSKENLKNMEVVGGWVLERKGHHMMLWICCWIVCILSKIMIWYIMENLSIYVICYKQSGIRSSLFCISAWCMYMWFGWQIQRHRMNKLAWCTDFCTVCSLLRISWMITAFLKQNESCLFGILGFDWIYRRVFDTPRNSRPYTFCHRRSWSPIKARIGQWGWRLKLRPTIGENCKSHLKSTCNGF